MIQHQFLGIRVAFNMACGSSGACADLKKKSIFVYHRVLLFNYDVQCKFPFASYNRNMFSEEDIPPSWFTGPLSPTNRKKILPMPSLGGGRFSVFGKIEIGKFKGHSNNFLKHVRRNIYIIFIYIYIYISLKVLAPSAEPI